MLKGRGSVYIDARPSLGTNQGASSTPGVNPLKMLSELLSKPAQAQEANMPTDRAAELMALLQGKGGGLGVDQMYAPPPANPVMDAMQGGANIQRGRFGMPQQAAQEAAPSDEEMLEQVRQGMGGGSDIKGQDVNEDLAALEADPTPENVQAFTDQWGQDKLPPGLGGTHY
jgi:hypothetical protein